MYHAWRRGASRAATSCFPLSLSRSSVINVGHSFEQPSPPIEPGRVRTFARDKPVRQSSDRYRGAQVPVRCVGGCVQNALILFDKKTC